MLHEPIWLLGGLAFIYSLEKIRIECLFSFFVGASHCSRCNINEKSDTKVFTLKDIPFGRQMISNKHDKSAKRCISDKC